MTVSDPSDYYQLLGLKYGASPQEVRRAYRDLSKLYHPDTTELESAIATVKFQSLNEAYATLSNPEKRLAYDYKIGYSRLSVMQPLPAHRNNTPKDYDPTASAYISSVDRPLSGGELFALFILGVTFVGCLLLVVTISLTRGDMSMTQGPTEVPSDLLEQLTSNYPQPALPDSFDSSNELSPFQVSPPFSPDFK